LYRLEDVFGDTKDVTETEDMTGVEDMMTGVEGTTGVEKGVETTKNGIRNALCIHRNSCHKNDDTPMKGSTTR